NRSGARGRRGADPRRPRARPGPTRRARVGRRDRHLRIPSPGRPQLGRAARRRGPVLRVRVEHLGLRKVPASRPGRGRAAGARATGVFNATGPVAPLTLGAMLETVRSATGARCELAWVEEARLAEAGVEPWDDLPLWLDLTRQPDFRGFLAVDVSRALAAGLDFRSLEDTVLDKMAWLRDAPGPPTRAEGGMLAQTD